MLEIKACHFQRRNPPIVLRVPPPASWAAHAKKSMNGSVSGQEWGNLLLIVGKARDLGNLTLVKDSCSVITATETSPDEV